METSTGMPAWPSTDPQHGNVRLRAFRDEDVATVIEMSRDEYFPAIGSLPGNASPEQAMEWVERQRNRYREGAGFSFAVADAGTDRCVGQLGLWIRELEKGRAQAGYGITPSARGHRFAASALLAALEFAWTLPELHRVELHIEPWNTASTRTAELAGFEREGLLRSYMEISGQRRDLLIYSALRERKA
ncbi:MULTISPECIES: GNAT family protein [unclassified Arthrobacter]|uniref:GNAT family N-acetyltransferase n=1 Tax=unclassified Arthrobacter TaxID=235627 RepID=UPI001E33389F|nr:MULTISPECIES: GNAT family protein [unclassified Arthrobacter]MCC9144456.1 GNAT family N-acetyltransferase [Arthrobacter sp. zg-Y919]MDK1275682.1 GNAT family protein [Arthrobacter sp. zg.Y919]WIB02950.1 GNAT family protein [Arthrobacter sp. zg-Y919]